MPAREQALLLGKLALLLLSRIALAVYKTQNLDRQASVCCNTTVFGREQHPESNFLTDDRNVLYTASLLRSLQ